MNIKVMDAKEVEEQYHQACAEEQYATALDLATRYFDVFPQHAHRVVYFWRIEAASKLGDGPLALTTLREAIDAGHWFTKLDENPTFAILKEHPEFETLVALCAERRAEEMANAPTVIKVLQPENSAGTPPSLIALHGNSGNVETFAPHWQAAVEQGWLVCLPQSPQSLRPGMYVWNDWDWVIPELQKYVAAVKSQHATDEARSVLAGFSMGSGLAIWLALEKKLTVKGVLAVAPFLSQPQALRPLLAQEASRSLRFYLVASKDDEYCYQVAIELAKLFTEYQIEYQLDIYEETGHLFPPLFEAKVPEALAYLVT